MFDIEDDKFGKVVTMIEDDIVASPQIKEYH